MADAFDSVRDKVLDIFREKFGDLADRLDGARLATPAMDAIASALTEQHGLEEAEEIALHMADWNWDAAFIVALHLYPQRFTKEEIDDGIGLFLTHAPNHIRAACGLTGHYVWESWPNV
jgi:hypothetical protein